MISVIPIFLEMIRRGERLGGVVIDEGEWRDLGNRAEYLRVHRDLYAERPARFPRYGTPDPGWRDWVHPSAVLGPGARILGASVVGAGARLGEDAVIDETFCGPVQKLLPEAG